LIAASIITLAICGLLGGKSSLYATVVDAAAMMKQFATEIKEARARSDSRAVRENGPVTLTAAASAR
jgi:hypothetical protein